MPFIKPLMVCKVEQPSLVALAPPAEALGPAPSRAVMISSNTSSSWRPVAKMLHWEIGLLKGPGRLADLMQMVVDGKLDPVIGEVANLENAAHALARMGAGQIPGKLVIRP